MKKLSGRLKFELMCNKMALGDTPHRLNSGWSNAVRISRPLIKKENYGSKSISYIDRCVYCLIHAENKIKYGNQGKDKGVAGRNAKSSLPMLEKMA